MKIFAALKLWYKGKVCGDEPAQHYFAEKLSQFAYPKYRFSEFGRLYLEDKEFLEYYHRFEGMHHYRSFDRKHTVNELMKLVKAVPGDTVECGVYRGATSYLICKNCIGTGKTHHVFDSFEGLSIPNDRDGTYWKPGSLSAPEDIVKRNLAEFEFVRYYKGWIPTRFTEISDRRFSFIHIDVDLHQPTLDSLNFFYSRINPGGLIIIDDYGFTSCPGAKDASDTFMADKAEPIIQLTTGQCLIFVQGKGQPK